MVHKPLYIRRNGIFFAISYGWGRMSGNQSNSAFFEGGESLWAQISEGRGHRPPTTVGVRVALIALSCGIKISAVHHWYRFVTIHACDRQTDGRTDGQRDRITTPKTVLACSRGKNEKNRFLSHPLGHLGVTYAFHLWLVGKPVVDFIFVVIELFAICYGWDVMSGNRSKYAFFEGVGHFERRFQRERGIAHQIVLVSEN